MMVDPAQLLIWGILMDKDSEDREVFRGLTPEQEKVLLRKVFDDAIRDWLDKKFADFGRWSLKGIMAAAFSGLVYWYVHTGGFK